MFEITHIYLILSLMALSTLTMSAYPHFLMMQIFQGHNLSSFWISKVSFLLFCQTDVRTEYYILKTTTRTTVFNDAQIFLDKIKTVD